MQQCMSRGTDFKRFMDAGSALRGVVVAPVTPMNNDLSVDYGGIRSIIEHLIDAGVSGFTACAMTAEAESLSLEEQEAVLAAVVESVAGRVPVYSGVGRPSILETRRLISVAEEIGSNGLFVITPYCNAYTKAEAIAYLRDVATRTSLPIMIYNCPAYSRIDLTPEDHSALSEIANIVATKEGNQGQLHDTVLATEGRMSVFTARDSYLLPSLALGAVGVVSFAANVAPRLLVELYEAVQQGDTARASELHAVLSPLVNALVARSYPLMIKAAMELNGLAAGPARRIEQPLAATEVERLRSALEAAQAEVQRTNEVSTNALAGVSDSRSQVV